MKQLSITRRRALLTGVKSVALLHFGLARAQAARYPHRAIKMVIPWSAGGSTDVIGRVLAESMGKDLGVSVVVDNKPGATGTIGYAIASRSEADGYTLLLGTNSTFAMAPHFYKELPYNIDTDFTPLGMIASNPQILCVHPDLPAKNVAELIQYLKQHPGKVPYASAGQGGSSHLAMELFLSMSGSEMLHVPYKGGAPAVQSLMAGDTRVAFVDLSLGDALIKRGAIRALGTSGLNPSAALPEVPAIAQAGVPGFESLTSFGLFGTRNLPASIVERVNQALRFAMKDGSVQKRLSLFGFDLMDPDPALYQAYAKSEREKWGRVIRQRHITLG